MANYKVASTKVRAVTEEDLMGLPRGFRFHPTDEEIVVHYLIPKALNSNFSAAAIGQADFNKCEPWDLPKKANMGDTERYYYCQRDRKYPSGLRTNRATKAGYWKATGKDKEIYKAGMQGNGSSRVMVGMKKTLVFYTGRAPNGEKTNWVMHEYRLIQPGFSSIPKDDGWVVSRVFHKTGSSMHKRTSSSNSCSFSPVQERPDSFSTDELISRNDHDFDHESLPPLVDPSSATHQQVHQDMKQKATMPTIISNYGLQQQPANIAGHSSSSIIHYACHDDDQLIYSHDPAYYYLSTSETLFETLDSLGYENIEHKNNKQNVVWSMMDDNKCKVEHQSASSAAISNKDINVEVSSDDTEYDRFLTSSTLGSMPDLSKLWDY